MAVVRCSLMTSSTCSVSLRGENSCRGHPAPVSHPSVMTSYSTAVIVPDRIMWSEFAKTVKDKAMRGLLLRVDIDTRALVFTPTHLTVHGPR